MVLRLISDPNNVKIYKDIDWQETQTFRSTSHSSLFHILSGTDTKEHEVFGLLDVEICP